MTAIQRSTIQIPADLRRRIKQRAERSGVSVTQWVEVALERQLEYRTRREGSLMRAAAHILRYRDRPE
ncbi:ribbon-helix-helix protein, CopG family [Pseudoclavibacter sp. CFCC 14310]|nr:ribbon-helix-helix protein, CopG family [Pseudoclavibacter sp. CFCC 14310]KAB1646135.1 ribbon-helix-helix protein, CopG family [Pseudoclavibacter sp. CFCC 14310]